MMHQQTRIGIPTTHSVAVVALLVSVVASPLDASTICVSPQGDDQSEFLPIFTEVAHFSRQVRGRGAG